MKKTKLLVLLFLSIFWCSVSVWAKDDEEEVWKPDEPFFVEHEEACIVENREYYANGPKNQVSIYANPVTPEVIETLENGEKVLIDYVYTTAKGITWGFCEVAGKFGWLPMDYMVRVYDYLDFEADYGEQFVIERGGIVKRVGSMEEGYERYRELMNGSRRVRFWSYPGSSQKFTILLDRHGENIPQYTHTFVDEDGRKWGFIGYFCGMNLNSWVCLETIPEMLASYEELYPNGAPKRDKREITPYTGEEILPEASDKYQQAQTVQKIETATIVMGIAAAVVVAIILYCILWKKIKQA